MQSSAMRRKDTTKGPPLRILSLDGGGVRGYSMLVLLQELMHKTFFEVEGRAPRRHEIPKPCDHFDLIVGTGTGGLVALMLGRMRMDVETCKDVYVRMTKRVFETDKTFAGIPYRSTLFKASKLEEAIRDCVREHTIVEEEGNDDAAASTYNLSAPQTPLSPASIASGPYRSISSASRYSQIGMAPINQRSSFAAHRWGNPNALLYDSRENRTKTAVTAIFKGTRSNGNPILLRSYDSRKEPAPEFNCTIWQAGRATSATGLAFKPIQIGQHVFIDEGAGRYNPAPQVLDEAICNEWPGREVGVFVSVGTGKRPSGTDNQKQLWWEDFVSSNIGNFAEARRRLISKIEGCEDTHQYMLREHLSKRRVNPENYYRLNVEVGVGEFGMNEWNRLSEISTNTRMYLAQSDVQSMNLSAAGKMGRIHRAKLRYERQLHDGPGGHAPDQSNLPAPPSNPMAVELPAEEVVQAPGSQRPTSHLLAPHYHRPSSGDVSPRVSSDEYPQPVDSEAPPPRYSGESYRQHQRDYSQSGGDHRVSNGSWVPTPRPSAEVTQGHDGPRRTPPPLPPKTPLPYHDAPNGMHANLHQPPAGITLPYPDTDGPPPAVNTSRKPEFGVR